MSEQKERNVNTKENGSFMRWHLDSDPMEYNKINLWHCLSLFLWKEALYTFIFLYWGGFRGVPGGSFKPPKLMESRQKFY